MTAFPHALTKEKTLPHDLTRSSFICTTDHLPVRKKIIFMPALFRKYILLLRLKKSAQKNIDRYLVPSPFLIPVVQKTYATPDQPVDALSLFVSE
jgi:hypothetical protein